MALKGKPSDLQIRLAHQVMNWLIERGEQPGTHISEAELARRFGVSRSPMRLALDLLEDRELLEKRPNRGYFLTAKGAAVENAIPDLPSSVEEQLYRRIARERLSGALEDQVSEADLMRRFDATRGILKRVLQRLSEDGVIDRAPGHGWRFQPAALTENEHDESYAYRLLIEPASFDQPGFSIDANALAVSRARHEALMAEQSDVSASQLVETNADFHEMLARFSNNRYLISAVQSQNQMRRLMEIEGSVSKDRVRESCLEHLSIIRALEGGDPKLAQLLLKQHLMIASRLKLAFSDRTSFIDIKRNTAVSVSG
jgi:DNA-binding GntR family transcriptional regulator